MPQVQIKLTGATGSGKTILLKELAVFLKSKGHTVECVDDGGEHVYVGRDAPKHQLTPREIHISTGYK